VCILLTFFASINSAFSALSLLWLLPIAAVVYLDTRMVYYGIRKEGWRKPAALILSFALSLGALGWGLWSIFTNFSLALMFVTAGGGLLLLFSLRSLTFDKNDLKHER
jgi:hypothetical protein